MNQDRIESVGLGAVNGMVKKGTKSARRLEASERAIRDSFTIPPSDYSLISVLKDRCLKRAVYVTKSELLRAGLNALNGMSDQKLIDTIGKLVKLKPGRPKSREKSE